MAFAGCRKKLYLPPQKQSHAGVVKLVDTLDLGSSAVRHGGSSPSTRTKSRSEFFQGGFFVAGDWSLPR